MSNFIPQDPLILPLVIVEPFGGAPADLVEGIGSLAEELNVRVQVNCCYRHELKTSCRISRIMHLLSSVYKGTFLSSLLG